MKESFIGILSTALYVTKSKTVDYQYVDDLCQWIKEEFDHENAKQQNKLQPTDLETGEANHTES